MPRTSTLRCGRTTRHAPTRRRLWLVGNVVEHGFPPCQRHLAPHSRGCPPRAGRLSKFAVCEGWVRGDGNGGGVPVVTMAGTLIGGGPMPSHPRPPMLTGLLHGARSNKRECEWHVSGLPVHQDRVDHDLRLANWEMEKLAAKTADSPAALRSEVRCQRLVKFDQVPRFYPQVQLIAHEEVNDPQHRGGAH